MRYIDADALEELHCEDCNPEIRQGCKDDPVCASLWWIKDAPTVDVVEVEKLEELQWYHHTENGMVEGGNSTDEMFEPYVKWADIEKIYGGRE